MRSGHTEAAVDLCRLAGLPPVGVICELVNDDGTVMRGAQIEAFAETHGLKSISVADLIAYRQAREKLVERVAELPGRRRDRRAHGLRLFDAVRQRAASRPRLWPTSATGRDVPVEAAPRQRRRGRLRRRPGRSTPAHAGLRPRGPGRPRLSARRHGRGADDELRRAEASASERRARSQWREVGLGAQILRDLGVRLDPQSRDLEPLVHWS